MEEVHKRKSDFSHYLQVSTGALDRWDVVWKPAWGIEENISEKEKKGWRLVHVSPLQRAHYRPLSLNPPSPRIPVVPRVSESPCAPSIHTGGDSITPWWKAMENQLGIQGRASTMHGHTACHRQAICCDEEALYTARMRPLGSPSSPTEPNTHFFQARHTHISAHIKLESSQRWGLHGYRDVLRCVLFLFKDCSRSQRSMHMPSVWINVNQHLTWQLYAEKFFLNHCCGSKKSVFFLN